MIDRQGSKIGVKPEWGKQEFYIRLYTKLNENKERRVL